MLLRIPVSEVRLGMYIQKLEGPWSDHPFWLRQFMIERADDLARLQASRTQAVWIDPAKSTPASLVPPRPPAREAAHPMAAPAVGPPPSAAAEPAGSSMDDELPRAWLLRQQGAQATARVFEQARLGKIVDLAPCRTIVDDVVASLSRHHGALLSLCRMKSRDEYTYLHSLSVCALMAALGLRLGLDAATCRAAGLAGFLHDIGKARLPLTVLNKPGKLTDGEFALIKSHPVLGHALLLEGGETDPVALDVCLHHHEKMDGSGYPHGLRGEEISVYARMGAICDVYDAVTSDRPYKAGWDPAEAIGRMAGWTGHLDPRLMNAFIHAVGVYPPGSLVRLVSGRLGVVVESHPVRPDAPVVKVFHSTKSGLPIPVQKLDLASPACRDRITRREPVDDWKFPQLHSLWSEELRLRAGLSH